MHMAISSSSSSKIPVNLPNLATTIEKRIAQSLADTSHFDALINASELTVIMRAVVETLFSHRKVAGLEMHITSKVRFIDVAIEKNEVKVSCQVDVLKPISAEIGFIYTLVNGSRDGHLRLKKGTLIITEQTRRFDFPAKAALRAINVRRVARQELNQTGNIIRETLPQQLKAFAVSGTLTDIKLTIENDRLRVKLAGLFSHATQDEPTHTTD